jgi:hypothetical protein
MGTKEPYDEPPRILYDVPVKIDEPGDAAAEG